MDAVKLLLSHKSEHAYTVYTPFFNRYHSLKVRQTSMNLIRNHRTKDAPENKHENGEAVVDVPASNV